MGFKFVALMAATILAALSDARDVPTDLPPPISPGPISPAPSDTTDDKPDDSNVKKVKIDQYTRRL
jgi:hypothetical protein